MEYCCIIKRKEGKREEDYEFWIDDDLCVISDFFEKVKTDTHLDLLASKPWFIGSPAPCCVEICLYGEILNITLYPADHDEYLALDIKMKELVMFLYSLCEGSYGN